MPLGAEGDAEAKEFFFSLTAAVSTVLCTKSLFYDDDNDDVLRFFKIILAHLTANTSLSFFEQSSFAHWDLIYNLPFSF